MSDDTIITAGATSAREPRFVANWYVVRHKPQLGRKAAAELREHGIKVWVPKRSTVRRNRRSGKETVKWTPLLVGYLFVRFRDDQLDGRGVPPFILLSQCEGVGGILTSTTAAGERMPFRVPDKDVTGFIRRQRQREFGPAEVERPAAKAARLKRTYRPGKIMRITGGLFEAMLAEIQHLDDRGHVTVKVINGATILHNVQLGHVEDVLAALAK